MKSWRNITTKPAGVRLSAIGKSAKSADGRVNRSERRRKMTNEKKCKCGQCKGQDHFPGYPQLKRFTYSDRYGRMELLAVNRTSDGYLIGTARIGEDEDSYIHDVFIGGAK